MGKGVDWQSEVFQNAPISNHNINVSGGTDNVRYFISGSAMMKDGLIHNSSYDKYNLRSSLDLKIEQDGQCFVEHGIFVDKSNEPV